MAAVFSLPSAAGTTLFSVDDSGNGVFAGSVTSAGPSTGITNLTATGNTSLGDAAADTVTITGHVDIDSARTTAGSGLDIDGTINSASAAFSGLDITAVQLTTARTSGTVNGVKAATTSLAGDLNSVVYADYRAAAPTDGGGAAVHAALVVEAGHDVAIDVSAAATGEADIVIGDNLAEALVVREAANAYLTLVSTNGSEAVKVDKTLDLNAPLDADVAVTAAGNGGDLDLTVNHATGAGIGLDVTAVQLTTARTAGTMTGVKAATTSLAGDLNSVVYADFRAGAPTDGGGAVVHAAMVVEAGHDVALDLSACATGEADIVIGDNLASAFEIREASNVFIRCTSTDGAETVTIGKPLSASCLFCSTEQTGTGGAQNIAHGLSATPTRVLIGVTEDPAGTGFDVAEGAHDATNVVVTVTTGVKFKVLALL